MKLTILKSSILMLTFAAAIASCKKEVVNEVKINDHKFIYNRI